MSKERPILFSEEMVRAILEGRKTQTRRVVKSIDHDLLNMMCEDIETGNPDSDRLGLIWGPSTGDDGKIEPEQWLVYCGDCSEEGVLTIGPGYGQPGDRLWVREVHGYKILSVGGTPHEQVTYRATDPDAVHCYDCNGNEQPMVWQEPEKMSRSESRITLEITSVRVERLQDISETDAKAEGAQNFPELPPISPWGQDNRWSMESPTSVEQCLGTARFAFANYFCKLAGQAPKGIHDPRPWDANPWVWVIEFKRVDQEGA